MKLAIEWQASLRMLTYIRNEACHRMASFITNVDLHDFDLNFQGKKCSMLMETCETVIAQNESEIQNL